MSGPVDTTPGRAGAATRIALAANPRSGSSDQRATEERLRALGAEVETFEIDDVERAAASGADRLAVAGGDGSLAPAAAAAGGHGIPLAVIPAGTANDFAARLGLPDGLEEACRLAATGSRLRTLDLGWIEPTADPEVRDRGRAGGRAAPPRDRGDADGDRRPFVNAASAGLPAPAAERAHSWKQPLGALAYAAGAVVAGVRERPLRCRVHCDDDLLYEGRVWQVTVACSGGFGSGSAIDEADPADGALDVVAVAAGARTVLLGMAVRLRRGDLSGHRAAVHAQGRTVGVDVPADAAYNLDGEVVTLGPARFGIEPGAYRLVVPEDDR